MEGVRGQELSPGSVSAGPLDDAIQAAADAKFRTIFEQGNHFAGVMNVDGTVMEANRLCLDSCGFKREDVIGRKFWDCGWWNRSPVLMGTIREATAYAAGGGLFRRETEYFIADGSRRFLDLTVAAAKDEAG
jgi:PAS domain S-box-containing protein